ncbi:hypothetical protein BDR03DRAFT_1006218 [Suillus americanus]|nr:hypothetical protein BDR03DRAFT_1006218 [Suillus americanus]
MHVDEDSAALAESMRVLCSRSNSRIPISRLPDDILLMIFELFEEEGLTTSLRNEGSSNVTYPSLELRRMRFSGDELEDLRDVLKMPAQHIVRVHDLRLTLCDNFTADEVQLFREVVVNDVDCDQYTLGHS